MRKRNIVIFATIGLIAFFMVAGVMYKNHQASELETIVNAKAELLERPYSWSVGSKDAKVHIVKFFDPTCPACAKTHLIIKRIMSENEGKIRLTLRYAAFSQVSVYALTMLEATRKQDKYTKALEVLFVTQGQWAYYKKPNPELLWKLLPSAGVDIDRLGQDVRDPQINERIRQDSEDAQTLKITRVPTFFINGKTLPKFGYQELEDLINSELQK
jgi:protein-disulfide isomerase